MMNEAISALYPHVVCMHRDIVGFVQNQNA